MTGSINQLLKSAWRLYVKACAQYGIQPSTWSIDDKMPWYERSYWLYYTRFEVQTSYPDCTVDWVDDILDSEFDSDG